MNRAIVKNGRLLEPARFIFYSNYSAFIERWELVLARADDPRFTQPVAMISGHGLNFSVPIQWDGALAKGATLEPGTELAYVLRVPLEHAWSSNVNNSIATIDRIGPTAVATVTVPSLSTDEGVGLLMELFDELSQSGAKSLVLDLQSLEYLDSVCLGCLVQALNHAIQGGGRIALVNTDSNVQDLFRVTQINRLFPICHDVPAALTAIERAG